MANRVGFNLLPVHVIVRRVFFVLCLARHWSQAVLFTHPSGSIAALSTSIPTSKFVIGLSENREDLLSAFQPHRFLNMVHVQTGSQGLCVGIMVDATLATHAAAQEVKSMRRMNFANFHKHTVTARKAPN